MMKRYILFSIVLFILLPATAQRNDKGEMPQYLLTEFIKTRVLMKSGASQYEMMNYNTVTEKMVYRKDDNYWDLANPEMVDTVYLGDMKFIPFGKYFFEAGYISKITLFIQHKGTLMSAGSTVGYGGKSQLASTDRITGVDFSGGRFNLPLPTDFIVNPSPVYWIRKNGEMLDFLTEKQFLRYFETDAEKIRDFIKDNKLKIDKPDHLSRIVRFCNDL